MENDSQPDMTALRYCQLTDHRPDQLMKHVKHELDRYYYFLKKIKKFMEEGSYVSRVAWEPENPEDEDGDRESSESPAEEAANDGPVWLTLVPPEDLGDIQDSVFLEFMNKDIKYIYASELPPRDCEGKRHFNFQNKLLVLERKEEGGAYRIRVEKKPDDKLKFLIIKPNTYNLLKQIDAIQSLKFFPREEFRPLMRLAESKSFAQWPPFEEIRDEDIQWNFLKDRERPGTEEQRQFVRKAMGTPDFALLEGPPGSGKTTAICELIHQLTRQGKRILLCASTHVAVDNVLDRLMDDRTPDRDRIIPIRIGRDGSMISENAKRFFLDNFIREETARLKKYLSEIPESTRSNSQQKLYDSIIKEGNKVVQTMALMSANLICGTTIGILQHPDLRNSSKNISPVVPEYDYMIIDEASKTTFQEFLVPALHAKRWIIVGDCKQLSPYTDDVMMEANLYNCLPDSLQQKVCLDVFMANHFRKPNKNNAAPLPIIVISKDPSVFHKYEHQAMTRKRPVACVEYTTDFSPKENPSLILLSPDKIKDFSHVWGDKEVAYVSFPDDKKIDLPEIKENDGTLRDIQDKSWSSEVAWRILRIYENRLEKIRKNSKFESSPTQLETDLEDLLPAESYDQTTNNDANRPQRKSTKDKIKEVKRLALPSILESIQFGVEIDDQRKREDPDKISTLQGGMEKSALGNRHVLLKYQHRMHPEIARFSKENIYNNEALESPPGMEQNRNWGFKNGVVRFNVQEGKTAGFNSNPAEATAIIDELKDFDDWCRKNPKEKSPWEVAVLTFYRAQEKEIRIHLREWSGQTRKTRYFERKDENGIVYMKIELCTVDRFQGHEADLVALSFVNDHPTVFLRCPNRLNVALTRARYCLMIFANRNRLKNSSETLLSKLMAEEPWTTKDIKPSREEPRRPSSLSGKPNKRFKQRNNGSPHAEHIPSRNERHSSANRPRHETKHGNDQQNTSLTHFPFSKLGSKISKN